MMSNEVELFYDQTRFMWKLVSESNIPKRQQEGLLNFLDALGNIDTPQKLETFLDIVSV